MCKWKCQGLVTVKTGKEGTAPKIMPSYFDSCPVVTEDTNLEETEYSAVKGNSAFPTFL